MNGVKIQEMGASLGIASDFIDMNQFDAGSAPEGAEHQAADTPETIDPYLQRKPPPQPIQIKSTKLDGLVRPVASADALAAEQARARLKALADPLRLQILESLAEGERCVCDLTGDLGLSQSKLSFHLRVLREAGLLAQRSSGRWVYYSLQPEAIEQLSAWLLQLRQRCNRPAQPCG